ncbi:unnamed protein product [Paramecium sonneborni]|uniref:Uncharacterized protein n=1 Tax=Paramecium sonneborni TaxID=65129 RepID=A0A8S1RST0_9CILI|nr:unnamed protein product [Paramecium sonneborni]
MIINWNVMKWKMITYQQKQLQKKYKIRKQDPRKKTNCQKQQFMNLELIGRKSQNIYIAGILLNALKDEKELSLCQHIENIDQDDRNIQVIKRETRKYDKKQIYSFIRKEYMNIQNPYYVIPNSQQKLMLNYQNKLNLNDINNQNENSLSCKSSVQKKKKQSKIQKKKIKKQNSITKQKEPEKKINNNIIIEQNEEVLNGIISAESCEVKVKEEDDNEFQANKIAQSLLSLSLNNNFNQFHNTLNSQQLFNESFISLYNSQVFQNQPQQQQQFQQSLYIYFKYYEGIANLIKSQSLSQSQLLQEIPLILSNVSSQEINQSSLMQLSLSNMNFCQFPYMLRQESFPHSMNNSQF